jgi:peptidoglycan/LPS O-acetylase OafA/YrhL
MLTWEGPLLRLLQQRTTPAQPHNVAIPVPDLTRRRASGQNDPVNSMPRIWIRPYYASFNGLRGLAVFTVFLNHYMGFLFARRAAEMLWMGVDIFFVLSGFLITGILYDSLRDPHFFRNFYVRRALRILPIFYGFFLLVWLLSLVLPLHMDRSMWNNVLYVGNLSRYWTDYDHHDPLFVFYRSHGHYFRLLDLGHLWSLCVEEQFYLLWPMAVWGLRNRISLMRLCTVLVAATLLGRFLLWMFLPTSLLNGWVLYYSTFTRCDSLLIGAWIALWLRERPLSTAQLRRVAAVLFCAAGAGLVLGTLASLPEMRGGRHILSTSFTNTAGYTLVALCAAGMLLASLEETNLWSRFLQSRFLTQLGIISYGFYFIHYLPVDGFAHEALLHPAVSKAIPFVAFAFAYAAAWLSFHFWETPFLRLKRILAPQTASRLHVPEPQPEPQA